MNRCVRARCAPCFLMVLAMRLLGADGDAAWTALTTMQTDQLRQWVLQLDPRGISTYDHDVHAYISSGDSHALQQYLLQVGVPAQAIPTLSPTAALLLRGVIGQPLPGAAAVLATEDQWRTDAPLAAEADLYLYHATGDVARIARVMDSPYGAIALDYFRAGGLWKGDGPVFWDTVTAALLHVAAQQRALPAHGHATVDPMPSILSQPDKLTVLFTMGVLEADHAAALARDIDALIGMAAPASSAFLGDLFAATRSSTDPRMIGMRSILGMDLVTCSTFARAAHLAPTSPLWCTGGYMSAREFQEIQHRLHGQ
jgi:hypothetical protein